MVAGSSTLILLFFPRLAGLFSSSRPLVQPCRSGEKHGLKGKALSDGPAAERHPDWMSRRVSSALLAPCGVRETSGFLVLLRHARQCAGSHCGWALSCHGKRKCAVARDRPLRNCYAGERGFGCCATNSAWRCVVLCCWHATLWASTVSSTAFVAMGFMDSMLTLAALASVVPALAFSPLATLSGQSLWHLFKVHVGRLHALL